MRKSGGTGLNVGGSSILVIFVLLCLTTFATLSMVSANADYRLTKRTSQAARDYYGADTRAEELYAQIDGVLRELYDGAAPGEYMELAAREVPVSCPGVEAELSPEGLILRYSVPMGETQELRARLEAPQSPSGQGGFCRKIQWQVVNIGDESAPEDTGMGGLWSGGVPGSR
jgi:hypothetical protein